MDKLRHPFSIRIIFYKEDLEATPELGYCSNEPFDSFPGISYYLRCHPNGSFSYHTTAGLYLFLTGIKNEEVLGEYTISIPSANFSLKTTYKFDGTTGYGGHLCEKNELYNPEKRFFVDGKMVVRVDGMLTLLTPRLCDFSWGLKADSIGQKLWNHDNKDFTLIVDKTKIKVHKCILSVCSPVFNEMLQNEWKEAKDNEVKIPDFDLLTVTRGLKFCYDIAPKELNYLEAIKLLKFADKYDIKKLHNNLENLLIFKISKTNVCKIANESILGNAMKLREACLKFLQKCLKERSPVGNVAALDSELMKELLIDAFSVS